MKWRDDETVVVSVTPVAEGVARPFVVVVLATAILIESASRVAFVHHHDSWFALFLVGSPLVVLLTRTWRWRAHKVHVTTKRVIFEGGVLRHWRTSVELRDVLATRVDQRVSERLARRGVVVLETGLGPIATRRVRHPDALCRLIDAERSHLEPAVPYDTVFTFEEPNDARHWPRHVEPGHAPND